MITDSSIKNELHNIYGEDNFNPEYLLPELRMYYETNTNLGSMLRHPFVYQIPFYSWKIANHSYEEKWKIIKTAIDERKWNTALCFYERPYRMSMITQWWEEGYFNKNTLNQLLTEWWTDTEIPSQFGYTNLLRLFKAAGFVTDGPEKPTERIWLYRGCKKKHKRGISWTRDINKAKFFSQRLNFNGQIWSIYAEPEIVMACFDGRGEKEVVLNTRMIKDYQITEVIKTK
jgi:hypothetical protein